MFFFADHGVERGAPLQGAPEDVDVPLLLRELRLKVFDLQLKLLALRFVKFGLRRKVSAKAYFADYEINAHFAALRLPKSHAFRRLVGSEVSPRDAKKRSQAAWISRWFIPRG